MVRYTQEHIDRSKRQLIEEGAKAAKTHGFANSDVASLAAAAGLTTGALYKHFDGKAAFFEAIVQAQLERTCQQFARIDAQDQTRALQVNAAYLSDRNVQNPGEGCLLPSLTPEVARAQGPVRDIFDRGLLNIVTELARLLDSPTKAWEILALDVGAVVLARALSDPQARATLMDVANKAGAKIITESMGAKKNSP